MAFKIGDGYDLRKQKSLDVPHSAYFDDEEDDEPTSAPVGNFSGLGLESDIEASLATDEEFQRTMITEVEKDSRDTIHECYFITYKALVKLNDIYKFNQNPFTPFPFGLHWDPATINADTMSKIWRAQGGSVCLDYLKGVCTNKRVKCKFLHPALPPNLKLENGQQLCATWVTARYCKFGTSCRDLHPSFDGMPLEPEPSNATSTGNTYAPFNTAGDQQFIPQGDYTNFGVQSMMFPHFHQ